ncbi:MFS transporter, partial [Candidatus Bathyarchaeota archaeon]|nr:MFS transporter [Candidatus Bathyarchaeota archaeon]
DLLGFESELIPFYLVDMIGSFSYGASSSILYGLLVDGLGFNTVQLGLMSTLFGLSWGLSQIPVGWMMDRYGRRAFLLLSQMANMIVMSGYISSRDFHLFLLLQIFSGMAHAMWIPAHIALVAERVPEYRRSLALGKISTYPLLLGIPAPYIGGLLYMHLGFPAPMMLRLLSLLLSFLIILLFIEERGR